LSLLQNCKVENLKSPSHKLLIVPISTPLLLGVYRDNILIETFTSDKKTSEVLLPLLMGVTEQYDISKIIYTRGPGSYMAIKLTYIMLKTLEILKGIECIGCSGFELNGGRAIKAIGNLYFIKEKETIMTKKLEQPADISFALPRSIHDLELDEESTPEYMLPAV